MVNSSSTLKACKKVVRGGISYIYRKWRRSKELVKERWAERGLKEKTLRPTISPYLLLLPFLLLAPTTLAQYNTNWDITNFHSDIEINKDSSITITEHITADFSREKHHGIFRNIPISYRDSYENKFSIKLNIQEITDKNGTPIPYKKSYQGDNINLKIGDPNTLVNKPTTYLIKYKVTRALLDKKDWDEIYWNINGQGWGVPMKSVSATVTLPNNFKQENLGSICFTGQYGSKKQNCTAKVKNGNTLEFKSTNELKPYEGLTIGGHFPKGSVKFPSTTQKLLWFIRDNFMLALPLLVLIFLYHLWYTRGRDPETRTTIVPQYKPPKNLTPTEVGTIIDEKVDSHDISATIIDLAIRGFLTIKESKEKKLFFFNTTEYTFILKNPFDHIMNKSTSLKPHEKATLESMFEGKQEVKLSDLTNKFYKDIPTIKDKVYKQLIENGYFPHNPEKIRKSYLITGVTILFISFFFSSLIIMFIGLASAISFIATGIIVIAFSFIMPRKTKKGAETYIYIKGFEEYIATAEKDRIKFYEDEKILFEQILPYAMVLGVGRKWAEAFKDIYETPPSWYQGHSWDSFNTIYLLDRMNSLNSSMGSTFTSSPRSASGGGSSFGGGGFSGGGFGGGGGGAW